jgi:phosphoribosylanthranilate isomerase
MIRVKVCGLVNQLNIMAVAEAEPDFMGFIFYRHSPRYVSEGAATQLLKNLPQSIKKTGVFVDESIDRIIKISELSGLDLIQLHGNESQIYCSELRSYGLPVMKVFNVGNEFSFETLIRYQKVCDYFLFDTKSDKPGGNGRKFDWKKLDEYSFDKPFFLSGGIRPEDADVIKSLTTRGLFAVDINSGFETAPGFKDPELVKTFIREIKNEKL